MNSNIDALSELVEIGERFISAPGSIVLSHDASTITHSGKSRVEKTVIGDDVFLGANAVVLPGAKIGDDQAKIVIKMLILAFFCILIASILRTCNNMKS